MTSTSNPTNDVVIIGAGLSGLAAAQVALDRGRSVTVLDKGRGVGGRLATRRIDGATLDHGAQFFTVRGDAFRTVVDAAIAEGLVDVWCHGFETTDGYPRYFGTRGMNAVAKWLADRVRESGGDIVMSARVASITPDASGWLLDTDQSGSMTAHDLVVTAPIPQTLALLDAGGVVVDEPARSALESVSYKPTLALLMTLDGPSAIPSPGGVQRTEDELFTFIADNEQKKVSAAPALTFHVNGTVSTDRWDDDPTDVIADLLPEAQQWIGDAKVLEVQLKKWKYAGPLTLLPDPCVVARTDPGALVLAGDAFAGPKVEGAFNSGVAAGMAVSST